MPNTKVDFRYTTIDKIREEGLTVQQLSDAKAIRLIQFYSARINRWTDHWFFPVQETVIVDGTGLKAVWREDKMPMLEVTKLTVNFLGSQPAQGTEVPVDDFVINVPGAFDSPGRVIELRVSGGFFRFNNQTKIVRFPVLGNFPKAPRNIEIIGTFGWVIQKDKVSTTTSASLATNAKTIDVVDASSFNPGDAIRIGDADPYIYALIDSISSNTIKFDDIGVVTTISSGASIVTYGFVPDAVEYACRRLVIEFRHQLTKPQFQEALTGADLTGEKIGDYSYTRHVPKYKNFSTTGLRDIDMVLQDYVPPNLPMFTR